MNEIKDRIRTLRKRLKLTQADFGSSIGVAASTVGNWEAGRQVPPESAIKSICREHKVQRDWLETGDGEMFEPTLDPSQLSFADQIAAIYVSLPDVLKQVWRDVAQKIIEAGDDQEKAIAEAEAVVKAMTSKKDC